MYLAGSLCEGYFEIYSHAREHLIAAYASRIRPNTRRMSGNRCANRIAAMRVDSHVRYIVTAATVHMFHSRAQPKAANAAPLI